MKSSLGILGVGLLLMGCGSDDEGNAAEPGGEERGVGSLVGLSPVEKLVYTLGGPDGFQNIQGLSITATGSRWLPHEGASPDAPPVLANEFERTVSMIPANDFLRVDVERDIEFLFPGPQAYSEILRGNLGVSTQPRFGAPLGDLTSDRVAAIQVQEMFLSPHLLVSRLGAGIEEDIDVAIDGALYHRLQIEAAQTIYLFVEAATGLLARIDTLEHDFYRRDVVTSVAFEGWQSTESGVAYPSSVRLSRDDLLLLEQEVTSFEVNPDFDADTFQFPAESAPVFDAALFARGGRSNQWYFLLESIGLPFTGIDTMVNAVEVAPGVRQLQGASHHSFLVEQAAGLVLVDAPLYQDRSGALLDYIEANFANKPITHVVASHFHEDHVAGIREVLGATDAVLVVHESTADFWRETIEARSTIYPDALARSPRQVEILTVPDGDSLTLEDTAHPVELFDMNATHANDLLLTRDVTSNTVFVVDIYSPGNGTPFEPETLDATILDNDIPTDTLKIVGGHGNEQHAYTDLEAFL